MVLRVAIRHGIHVKNAAQFVWPLKLRLTAIAWYARKLECSGCEEEALRWYITRRSQAAGLDQKKAKKEGPSAERSSADEAGNAKRPKDLSTSALLYTASAME